MLGAGKTSINLYQFYQDHYCVHHLLDLGIGNLQTAATHKLWGGGKLPDKQAY